jgi:hypothetical protein
MLAFLAWGVVLWLLLSYYLPGNQTHNTPLLVLASFLLVTAVHEVGHLIAYLSLGFQPMALHVGPIFFTRYFAAGKRPLIC